MYIHIPYMDPGRHRARARGPARQEDKGPRRAAFKIIECFRREVLQKLVLPTRSKKRLKNMQFRTRGVVNTLCLHTA